MKAIRRSFISSLRHLITKFSSISCSVFYALFWCSVFYALYFMLCNLWCIFCISILSFGQRLSSEWQEVCILNAIIMNMIIWLAYNIKYVAMDLSLFSCLNLHNFDYMNVTSHVICSLLLGFFRLSRTPLAFSSFILPGRSGRGW